MSNPASAGVPNPALTFEVTPYKPDGGANAPGVLMLITALVLAGAALGFVAHYISQWFYLILVFPCVIGFALGFLGGKMVKRGHVRNPWLGALAGFLGGVFAMSMMHYFDYESYKKGIAESVPEFQEWVALPPAELAQVAEQNYEQPQAVVDAINGTRSLPAFVDMTAREGVKIGKAGRSDRPMNLGYVGSYIYWIVEVLIVAGITLFMIRDEAAAPFCVACSDWKTNRALGGIAGDANSAKSGVSGGDMMQIAAAGPTPDATNVVLYVAVCPHCGGGASPVDLKLVRIEAQKQGKAKETKLAHATWPAVALPAVEALFAAPAVVEPAPPPVPPAA